MTRRSFLWSAAAVAAGCGDGRPRLNVFNWSAYVAPETIPDFEREFGVRVRYAVYDSNEEMLARVLGGNSGWDVVFPSNYFIGPMSTYGLLAPLDHSRLPNLGHLEARSQRPSWDPELRWCVPYMSGASGILYRQQGEPPSSWADMWTTRWQGRETMLDDPAEVIGACLMKAGLRLNACDQASLEKARVEAFAQKRLLRAYLNAEVRDQVVAGDVLAAQLWATTAQQAIDSTAQLRFAYPSEGFALYADTCAILRESRRQELAHRFLDYLLRPQVAARIASFSRTATVNASARALLPADLRNSPTLYPDAAVLARGQWFEALPPEGQKLRDRLWTEIKAS